ncbi:MAG TPA: divalent-cation tolerance protein CutA [Acidobacteriaceae bacterium]|nr:divalent-cation tolerance protein CutA [Acidobacteriaceae bacterium]
MEENFVIVLTTVGTKQFAADLAHSVVQARLAACVHIQAVQSVYRWQGEIRSEPEWQLAIKTSVSRYLELERHIRAHHSYETPEIVGVPIVRGSQEYLTWLAASVSMVE